MQPNQLSDKDYQLVDRAKETFVEYHDPKHHEVSAAIRTSSGNVYTAMSLDTTIGTDAVYAEPIAIGRAIMNDETQIDVSVAIWEGPDGEMGVISACGICRELIRDYNPETWIIVPEDDSLVKYRVSELLPAKL